MVPYGTIWYHMVPYGTIWYHMVPYCTIWYHNGTIMVPYGTIWYHMIPYGTVWYHMVPYGFVPDVSAPRRARGVKVVVLANMNSIRFDMEWHGFQKNAI